MGPKTARLDTADALRAAEALLRDGALSPTAEGVGPTGWDVVGASGLREPRAAVVLARRSEASRSRMSWMRHRRSRAVIVWLDRGDRDLSPSAADEFALDRVPTAPRCLLAPAPTDGRSGRAAIGATVPSRLLAAKLPSTDRDLALLDARGRVVAHTEQPNGLVLVLVTASTLPTHRWRRTLADGAVVDGAIIHRREPHR